FSEEEVEIIRNQNLRSRAIDDALMESYRINSERRNRVQEEIPAEIQRLKDELARWELEEKARVWDMLVSNCKGKNVDEENGYGTIEGSKTENDESVSASEGLSGHWIGYSIIERVYDSAGLTEEEMEGVIGASLPHEIFIEKDEAGQFIAYSVDTDVTVSLNVDGRAFHYYAEFTDPHDGVVYYEKMRGEVDENGTVIIGTAESGMPSSGPLYAYSIQLEKQD
ncbi:MAG: hypothetical protein NUK65_02025, partial [Firmicutes bacterium]|nr:hypothetical protein [Bacillota bacterium]